MAPRSVYSDIVLQYRVHICADIGENPDIGGGKKRGSHNLRRYRRHIGADMTPISVVLPISVKKLTISEVARNGGTIIYADIDVISEQISA